MYVHEYVPAQQLCFSNCIVKEIETVLIQGIVIATIVYVNLCGAIKIYIVLLRKLTCETYKAEMMAFRHSFENYLEFSILVLVSSKKFKCI